jgi:hypothetical protein
MRVILTKVLKAVIVDGCPAGCSSGTHNPFSAVTDQNSSSISSGSSVSALKSKCLREKYVREIRTIIVLTPHPVNSMYAHT